MSKINGIHLKNCFAMSNHCSNELFKVCLSLNESEIALYFFPGSSPWHKTFWVFWFLNLTFMCVYKWEAVGQLLG